jgi:hypothetical protein
MSWSVDDFETATRSLPHNSDQLAVKRLEASLLIDARIDASMNSDPSRPPLPALIDASSRVTSCRK